MKMIPKNLKVLLGGVLIVVIVFLAIRYGSKPKNEQEEFMKTPIEEVVDKEVKPNKSSNSQPVNLMSYTDAVEKYKGRRIQFDQNCQAFPANQSYKVGTSIMLDNRSPKPATISLGGAVYLVEAYGYHIANLPSAGLFTANCNSQRNVLTLSVQR